MADDLKAEAVSAESVETAENSQVNSEAQTSTTHAETSENKPVNLYQIPEFQNYQRSMDQKIAALQRQASAAEQRAHTQAMAGMDEFERTKYERDLAVNRANELASALEQRDLMQDRYNRISALSQETGVPIATLNEAQTPDDLAMLVARYTKENLSKTITERVEEEKQRSKANAVDLGGGKASTTESRHEAALREAYKNGDSVAYIRLLRQG